MRNSLHFTEVRRCGSIRRTAMFVAISLAFLNLQIAPAQTPPPNPWQEQFRNNKAKAESGDAAAQNEVGLAYSSGQGVPPNPKVAIEWFRKSAAQNFMKAKYNLGVCYRDGIGVEKNSNEAIKWLTEASKQGMPEAQYTLGNYYLDGAIGPKGSNEGAKWLRKAAEQNYAPAQNNLGYCYYKGEGVEQDFVEAYVWYNLASSTLPEAASNRSDIEAKLSPAEVSKAQKRSTELRNKIEGKSKTASK